MTRKTIKEIISAYTKNDIPQQVKDGFEKWMLETDDFEEKNSALEEIWDEFTESDDARLKSAKAIMSEADALGSGSAIRTWSRRRGVLLWITSAAAVVLAVLSITLFIQSRNLETCLASSEWSKGVFYLPDSTQVFLNMGSRLYYSSRFNGKTRQVRLEGEGFFNVTKDASRPFIVKASDLDIQVLGTEFTVSAYSPEKVITYLQEGQVDIIGPGLKKSIRLTPDHALVYDGKSDSYTLKPVKAVNHTLWTGEKLEFDRATLFDICETVSHWYNVDIVCDNENFARRCRLTLTVRQEPLFEILNAISALAPISYSIEEPNHVIISR